MTAEPEQPSGRRVIFIVAGGPLAEPRLLRDRILEVGPEEVVCADGGACHVLELGLMPQAVIGDLDSLPKASLDELTAGGCRILRYPPRKDETDTELALRYALDRQPDRIEIYAALGGRMDHALANISLLVAAAKSGIEARIIDGAAELFVVSGSAEIQGTPGEIVSLFSVTTEVTGIDLMGFEYSLQNATMEIGKPYGVSNRLLGEKARVSVSTGYLLVIKTGEKEAPEGRTGP